MKNRVKRFIMTLMIAIMLTSTVSSTVTVNAKSINYQSRVKKAKKNLVRKVTKILKSWAYKPSCRITKVKRNGRYLTCNLDGSIGGGACQGKVRVDLKTGKVKVLESAEMFDVTETYSFKISIK